MVDFAIRKIIVILFSVCLLGTSARALIINATYDTSVTSSPEAAQIESAFNWVVQTYENQFTNPITVNITVYWGGSANLGQVGLGESYTEAVGSSGFQYPQLVAALRAARSDAYDSNAVSSLPASDPTGSGNNWYVPRAEAKALKLTSLGVGLNDSTEDGEVGFGTNDVSYTFNPTNRAVAGKFDFIGVAEHELTEAMGRTCFGLNSGVNYIPYDLFRYTAPGAQSFDYLGANVYFSIDDGTTDLKDFNDGSNGGDVQDWATGASVDSYDAFVSTGQEADLSTPDFIAMDIMGYNSSGIRSTRLTGTPLVNGAFQLTFTNMAGVSFSVLATTNLTVPAANWSVLGTAQEYPVGHYTFIDTPGVAQRFYRVKAN